MIPGPFGCSRLVLSRRSRRDSPRTATLQLQLRSIGIAFTLHNERESVMPFKNKIEWPRRPPRLGRLFDNVRPFLLRHI
jgi:hypothetical protein